MTKKPLTPTIKYMFIGSDNTNALDSVFDMIFSKVTESTNNT